MFNFYQRFLSIKLVLHLLGVQRDSPGGDADEKVRTVSTVRRRPGQNRSRLFGDSNIYPGSDVTKPFFMNTLAYFAQEKVCYPGSNVTKLFLINNLAYFAQAKVCYPGVNVIKLLSFVADNEAL